MQKLIVLISKVVVRSYSAFGFLVDMCLSFFMKKMMGNCGKNVMIKPTSSVFKGLGNLYLSNDVRIARYAVIYATEAKVVIGPKTGIAPYLKIVSGNHRTDVIGHFMFDANYGKRKEDDQDVILEGDHWIGMNVTILKGVTIGRGSVIAAGAIVSRSVPPYSIVAGVPAKVIKSRFTLEEAIEHEKQLYSPANRLRVEQLSHLKHVSVLTNVNGGGMDHSDYNSMDAR